MIVLCAVLFSTCFVKVSVASKSGTEKKPIVLKAERVLIANSIRVQCGIK